MSVIDSKKDVICLDTQILIWGIKGECEGGQEQRVEQAKIFLEELGKDAATEVHISSIVLGELLASKKGEDLENFFEDIHRMIPIDPFDAKAAYHFSRIWNQNKASGTYQALRDEGIKRETIKLDQLIVASAVAVGATRIYSHDESFEKIAKGFIKVSKMPRLEVQDDMQKRWEGNNG